MSECDTELNARGLPRRGVISLSVDGLGRSCFEADSISFTKDTPMGQVIIIIKVMCETDDDMDRHLSAHEQQLV
jgi:hypothetical protein